MVASAHYRAALARHAADALMTGPPPPPPARLSLRTEAVPRALTAPRSRVRSSGGDSRYIRPEERIKRRSFARRRYERLHYSISGRDYERHHSKEAERRAAVT